MPDSLYMGWMESPPIFYYSKTPRDVIQELIDKNIIDLAKYALEHYMINQQYRVYRNKSQHGSVND